MPKGVNQSLKRVLETEVAAPLLVALLIGLTFVTIPRRVVDDGAEAGWCSVLTYAHQRALQFGPDIVHPYGPLGFLITPQFTPGAGNERIIVDAALSFGVAASVCLLAWRLSGFWRVLLIGVFTLVASNIEYAPQDLLMDVGILCWGILSILESRRRFRIYLALLVLLAVFSALAKVSTLVMAGVAVSAVAGDLWLRGKYPMCLGLLTSTVLCMLGAWLILGQALSNFGTFLARGIAVSIGYEQAMALEPPTAVLLGGISVFALVGTVVALRCTCGIGRQAKTMRWRRLLWLAWLLSMLFLVWKHGFLRADAHHNSLGLGFAAVMIVVVLAVPCDSHIGLDWSAGFAWTGCILALLVLQTAISPQSLHLNTPLHKAGTNAEALIDPSDYLARMNQTLSKNRQVLNLPLFRQVIGSQTVDAFGNYPSYAVLNRFNYRPRPVFQSYGAYTSALMGLNEDFYCSKAAPAYVLFSLDPIDDRFPALEDSWLFRDLLINYDFVGAENRFLLLKAKPFEPARLALLREGTVQPNEPIDLSGFGDLNIWLQVNVKQTAAGEIRRLLYQSSVIRLGVRAGPAETKEMEFFAPAPMLAAGFVASPMLTNNDQVVSLYQGKPVNRPQSYSIQLPLTNPRSWRPDIHFRVYRIENPLGPHLVAPASAPGGAVKGRPQRPFVSVNCARGGFASAESVHVGDAGL